MTQHSVSCGCRKTILLDFLRHGFDGSGADNFFDAGGASFPVAFLLG